MDLIINQLIIGIMLGTIYALIATGYTLVYGILNAVQFAHGHICFLGAYLTLALYIFIKSIGMLNFLSEWVLVILAIGAGISLTAVAGFLFEKIFIKPFRESPGFVTLLSTVSAGFIISEGIKLFYPCGANPQLFPIYLPVGKIVYQDIVIRFDQLIIVLLSLTVFLFLYFFINKTKIGLQMRATAENMEAARGIGINLDTIYKTTFIVSAVVGAIGGNLNAAYYNIVKFDMGTMAGLIGFSAAVLGGLGNIAGTVMGGLVLGIVESFTMAFIPGGAAYKEIFSFLVVAIFLIFKPSGILGKKAVEKV